MWVALLVAGVAALAVPSGTTAQLPPVPTVPSVPVPVPTVPALPTPPPLPSPPPLPPAPAPVPEAPSLPAPPSVPDAPSAPAVPAPGSGSSDAPSGTPGSSGGSGGGGGASGGGASSSSGGGGSGGGRASSSSPRGGSARARAAARTPAQRRRAERRLQRAVGRLSGCLDELSTDQRRVLELRAGLGPMRAHSRRGVARILDVRVRRVRRLERRGLRQARVLSRAGGCSGAGAGTATASGGALGADIITPPGGGGGGDTAADDGAGKPATGAPDGTPGDSGDVRGESQSELPPLLGGDRADPGGVSLAIGIGLIVLALCVGFATPHVRRRLPSA